MTAVLLSCPRLSGSAVQTAIPVFEVPSAALLPLQIQSGAGDDLNVTVSAFLSDWALFRPEAMLTAAGNAGARNAFVIRELPSREGPPSPRLSVPSAEGEYLLHVSLPISFSEGQPVPRVYPAA